MADSLSSGAVEGDGALIVDFVGDVSRVPAGAVLTFGRAADLVIDEDPRLNRVVGRFVDRGGVWFLENHATLFGLTVVAADGRIAAEVAPGGEVSLPAGPSLVRFEVGASRFEVEVLAPPRSGAAPPVAPSAEAAHTQDWGRMDLNHEQRLLLVVLAEARLRDPAAVGVDPTPNRAVAARLGWTITKFNRKLDYLCARLSSLGVAGLQGDIAGLAVDRRHRLVDHVLLAGLITPDDLRLLDEFER